MMRHTLQVFFYELKRNFRRKGFLFMTFGIPIIAVVLLIGYRAINDANARNQAENPPPDDVAVQEEDGPTFDGVKQAGYIDLSGMFADPGDTADFLTPYPDEAAAKAALDAGEIDVYYIIAADYLETGDVTLVVPRFSLNLATSAPIRQLILSHLAAEMNPDLFVRLLNPISLQQINLQRDATGQTQTNFGTDFVVVYLFAIVLMLGVFTTNGYLMQTVIEEKETRLIEILISSMQPTALLAGKILALGVLGIMQIAVWLVGILLLAQVAAGSTALGAIAALSLEPGQILVLVLYFIFGYLFFAGAYGMVSAISNSMQEGPQYAVIFTLPAVIPLYFISLFTTTPDAPLVVGLSLFPITSPLAMVMRVTITTVPAWQIILSLVLLAIFDVLLIWMAGRLFRVQTLLAGKVPKLRDLPKLLRG